MTARVKKLCFINLIIWMMSSLMAAQGIAASYYVSGWNKGDKTSVTNATKQGAINEVSFLWYFSTSNVGIGTTYEENLSLVPYAKSCGLRVLAGINNYNWQKNIFDPDISHNILMWASRQNSHAEALVNLCVNKGFNGIDLDWESLYPTDKDMFSKFVTVLAQKLHQKGMILSISVHAKTTEPGNWNGPKSEDWAAIGAVVDEFKIMTYAYSGSGSGPGPISPPTWVDQVLLHAESLVPASKIMLGIHFYGLDWAGTTKGSPASPLLWTQTQALITKYNPVIKVDANGEANFTYSTRGVTHVVYFQDCTALSSRLITMANRHPQIRGIHIWRMLNEDPVFWQEIKLKLKS